MSVAGDVERVSADAAQGGVPPGHTDGRRFAAFISYARADEATAAWLHRQIETYRLPGALRRPDRGSDTAGLGPIFRDRADLAAAESLSAAIRTALADSAALIVLCSPAAAQSKWVNAEIRLFRELNPGTPILAAVVQGEPASVMPAALTEDGREPLAADFRSEGDGRKLAFLKIFAALAHVPLDALIQRDAQRKLRRVMMVTVGAVLALLAAVAMLSYAIQQRNEAQAQRAEADRRRAQAEGLVEFMLTDLRDRLRGVGRIDIMRSAVGSALDSYGDDDDRGELGPDGQGQLARLLHAVGEDDFGAGRSADAARSFQRAYRITAPLLAYAPRDPDRLFNHAQSEYWLGLLAYTASDHARTERHFQSYRALAMRLQIVEPDQRRSIEEIAFSEGNLCSLRLAQRRDAVDFCRRSYAAQERLLRLHPDDATIMRNVSNRAGWYADALEMDGNVRAAIGVRQRQLALARRLHAQDRSNYDHRDVLVSAAYTLASAQMRTGDRGNARALLNEASGMIGTMRRRDPDNRRWAELERMINAQLQDADTQR